LNDIISALHDSRFFKPVFRDLSTWRPWEVYLRGLFGLPIENRTDRQLFKSCTGLTRLPKERPRESFVICGRRSGKSFISAVIAVYLAAFKDWSKFLNPGEKGWIFILSVDKLQSRIIKSYVEAILNGSRYFRNLIQKTTAEEVELRNNVTIAIKTSSFRSVRGYTLLAAILEELAFWRSEDSANPDREILAAVRPALATIPDGLLIGISTPYSRSGVLWDQFKANFGKTGGPLIWKAASAIMNPTLDIRLIKAAVREDEAARAEWQAEWRSDITQFCPLELVEAAVVPGRHELPKVEGANYYAFADPSGGRSDSFTLGIAHREKTGKIVLDVLRERRPPFRPEAVVEEFAGVLKSFGVWTVSCDKYAGEWVKDSLSRNGVSVKYSELAASELYLNFLPLISNGSVELLDDKRLVAQFTGLERRVRAGGKDLITHYPGGHDDLANAAAGAVLLAEKRKECGFEVLEDEEDEGVEIGRNFEESFSAALHKNRRLFDR